MISAILDSVMSRLDAASHVRRPVPEPPPKTRIRKSNGRPNSVLGELANQLKISCSTPSSLVALQAARQKRAPQLCRQRRITVSRRVRPPLTLELERRRNNGRPANQGRQCVAYSEPILPLQLERRGRRPVAQPLYL